MRPQLPRFYGDISLDITAQRLSAVPCEAFSPRPVSGEAMGGISNSFYTVGFYTVTFYTVKIYMITFYMVVFLYSYKIYTVTFYTVKFYTGQILYGSKFYAQNLYSLVAGGSCGINQI
jgi:hypothetical protein